MLEIEKSQKRLTVEDEDKLKKYQAQITKLKDLEKQLDVEKENVRNLSMNADKNALKSLKREYYIEDDESLMRVLQKVQSKNQNFLQMLKD